MIGLFITHMSRASLWSRCVFDRNEDGDNELWPRISWRQLRSIGALNCLPSASVLLMFALVCCSYAGRVANTGIGRSDPHLNIGSRVEFPFKNRLLRQLTASRLNSQKVAPTNYSLPYRCRYVWKIANHAVCSNLPPRLKKGAQSRTSI